MSDMKILLTADLNVPESVKAINDAIEQIQKKIIKLHLEIDTSGLKNAQVILDKFGNKVEQQQAKLKKITSTNISSMGDESLRTLEARIKSINATLAAGDKAKVTTTTNAKGNIKSAVIEYKDATGLLIKEKMAWDKKVKEVVIGKDESGNDIKALQNQNVFKTVTKTYVDNIEQAQKNMQGLIDTTKKGINNVDLKKVGFFNEDKLKDVRTQYEKLQDELVKIQNQGKRLSEDEQNQFKQRIANIEKTTAQYKLQENQQNRLNRLGIQGSGQIEGFNFNGKQNSLRNQIKKQASNVIGTNVKADSVAITSTVIDPKTQQKLIKFTADVETSKDTFIRYKGSVDEASQELRILGETLKSTANRNLDFRTKFSKAMESIPIWMAGMTAFYGTLHFFTQGVTYVNEFNKSLTQLSIVYGQSQAEVEKLGEKFHDLGMEMGIATEEVAKGAVEFARQGLSQTETFDKMQTAIKYAKISNLDFTQSAEILTATVNSMGVSAEHAADIFSYMGDATATGSDEIGRAMQRVGGTAGAVGVQFEKVASWIATVSSRTRESAETIGNSIKTILARVQSLKEGGFDETDGTKINDVAKALASVGISLTNADGTFRNFGTVMDELGNKWATLDSRTQAYVATTVAGVYQQSRFLNLMEGYPQTIKLYEESLNKAGTAQRKFDLYQEGTEAKLQKLKNAWTGVFQNTFQDEGIQSVIEKLTSLVGVIDSAIKTTGGLPIILGIATIALFAFSKAVRGVVLNMGKSWINAIGATDMTLKRMAVSAGRATASITGVGRASKLAAVGVRGLALGAKSLLAAFLPMLALTLVVELIQKIATAMSDAKESAEALKKQNETVVQSWTTNRETVEKLISEYTELDKVTQGGSKFADTEQQEKYNQTMNDLAELLPNVVKSIDEKGQAHLRSAKEIENERKNMDALVEAQRNLRIEQAKKDSNKLFDNIDDARRKLKQSQADANPAANRNSRYNAQPKSKEAIAQYQVQVVMDQSSLANAINEAKDRFKQLVDDLAKNSETNIGEAVSKMMQEAVDAIDFSTTESANDGMVKVQNLVKQVEDFKKHLADGSLSRSGVSITQALEEIKVSAKNLGVKDVDAFADAIMGVVKNTHNAREGFDAFKKISDELLDSYKKSADTMEVLNGMLKDNAEGKQISAREAADLIAKDAALVQMFKVENGQIKLNTEAVKAKRDAEMKAFGDIAEAKRKELIDANASLAEMLKIYGIQVKAIQTVADAEAARNKVATEAGKDIGAAMRAGLGNTDTTKNLMENTVNLDRFLGQLGQLSQEATILKTSIGQIGGENVKTPKEKSPKKAIEEFDKLAEEFNRKNADIDKALAVSEARLARYSPVSQQYRDELDKQIGLLVDKQKLMHEEADRLRVLRDGYKKQLSTMGSFNKMSEAQKQKYNDLNEKVANLNSSIDSLSSNWIGAANDINSKNFEKVNSSIGEFEKRNEELSDSLSLVQAKMATYPEDSRAYREAMISQIDIIKKWQDSLHAEANFIREQMKNEKLSISQKEDYQKRLKELGATWWELEGNISQVNKSLKDQTKQVADDVVQFFKDAYEQQKQIVLDSIDDQIDAIEKRHDAEMDALDKQMDAYEKVINQKKESLQLDQDARKYNQDLAKAQENNKDIQKQINILELDKSAEGQKRLAELKKQLADSDIEIENMKYDHSIELQQDTLDKELDTEKERIDNLKENAEYEITIKGQTSKKKYDIAVQELKDEKEAQTKHYDAIIQDDRKWATLRDEIMAGHFENIQTMYGGLETFMKEHSELIGGYLQTNLIDKFAEIKKELNTINPVATQTMKTLSDADMMKQNAQAWKTADAGTRKQLSASNQELGKKNGWYYDSGTGVWYTDKTKKQRVFHDGGIVGSGAKNSTTDLVNKLFNTKPNEEVVKALQGELLTPEKNIANNFIPNMKKLAASLQTPILAGGGTGNITYEINVNIDQLIGDKNAGKTVASSIVTEVKKIGGKI